MPLLHCRFPWGEAPPPPDESEGIREPRLQRKNRKNRGEQNHGDPELPSSTVQALPVRVGPANPDRERTYQYWPFSTSLIDLLDSILFTHNPTWDDCQQLLQVLFTTEERERILAEARKRVLGVDGRPTAQPHLVDEGFPLLWPNWDFERVKAMGPPPPGMGTLPPVPDYSLPDLIWINEDTTLQKDDKDRWYRDQNNNLILPAILGRHLCEHLHTTTHLGEKKTLTLLQTACLRFPRQNATVREIIQVCKACQLMRTGKRQHTGTRYRGEEPGQHWEIDFTEVRPGKYGYRYLLVLVDTFSGWVKAFPTKGETATVVAKKILEEIVPRYGLPVTKGSDNEPAFVSQIVQGLAQALRTK
ncbi:hypothetical protein FD754_017515 [Muntiacus muntjak]|uniref:Integrase catalytic domain-containing protein n=1 Tax=Muntiacus muntjak TaxID=9888 RepID=A0A5N3VUJ3_MUNMU|nr:hypothetical protein FD754_017515 [Muntiacus muntjak]